MLSRYLKLSLVTLSLGLTIACGRTDVGPPVCLEEPCPCVFDIDCAEDHLCIDSICIRRDDYQRCIEEGARPEECNGRDDNCNGLTDEGLLTFTCENIDNSTGLSCTGHSMCNGRARWVCDAIWPSLETCDGVDNDCDGETDEDFKSASGLLIDKLHCGSCGRDCDSLIPEASETECLDEGGSAECRVVSCPVGMYINEDRSHCLKLPDALCVACIEDSDCPGPGSKCLSFDEGEMGCGRSCAPDSPYGVQCPPGYSCQEEQCRPNIDTCRCNANSLGVTRSCVIDTCDGFQTCANSPGGFTWGQCDISAHRETCDGLDNDCDGVVDNGFLNQATKRYESDFHCGVCNNDCTRQWVPEVHHAVGGCDSSQSVPGCVIARCLTENVGGQSFEWLDVNKIPEDGCECRRRSGNTASDLPDMGSFPDAGHLFADENCDGIDGVVAHAIFVSRSAAVAGDGSINAPFDTISRGLQALSAQPAKRYVIVAEGIYRESLTLREGQQIFGGYSDDFRTRDVVQLSTIIQSPLGGQPTIQGNRLGFGTRETILSGLHIFGPDISAAPAENQLGQTSVALQLESSGNNLRVQNNIIRGGRAGAGGRGASGNQGWGRQDDSGLNGGRGQNAQRSTGSCPVGTISRGGDGGENLRCGNASARRGGNTGCPSFDWNQNPPRGPQVEYINPMGNDGEGGFHWSFDQLSGFSCSHVTESGFPSDFQEHNGLDGRDGRDGTRGGHGLGCRAGFGTIRNGAWEAVHAQGGRPGGTGQVGGAGGAGGGTAFFPMGQCDSHEIGSSGGGGGAGGCGGSGGQVGRPGGASIAILVSSTGPVNGRPQIIENRIRRGTGGPGGDGGFGGAGGRGGGGGSGGRPTTWSSSHGGKGGDGGNGGPGGSGGGGCGGPSLGFLVFGQGPTDYGVRNSFALSNDADLGGAGGAGGGGLSDTAGVAGGARRIIESRSCGAAANCPVGLTCNAGGVCMP